MKKVYAASAVLFAMAMACVILMSGLIRTAYGTGPPPEIPRMLYGEYVVEVPVPAGSEVTVQIVYDGRVIQSVKTEAQWGYSRLDLTGDGNIRLEDAVRILQIFAGM